MNPYQWATQQAAYFQTHLHDETLLWLRLENHGLSHTEIEEFLALLLAIRLRTGLRVALAMSYFDGCHGAELRQHLSSLRWYAYQVQHLGPDELLDDGFIERLLRLDLGDEPITIGPGLIRKEHLPELAPFKLTDE